MGGKTVGKSMASYKSVKNLFAIPNYHGWQHSVGKAMASYKLRALCYFDKISGKGHAGIFVLHVSLSCFLLSYALKS